MNVFLIANNGESNKQMFRHLVENPNIVELELLCPSQPAGPTARGKSGSAEL